MAHCISLHSLRIFSCYSLLALVLGLYALPTERVPERFTMGSTLDAATDVPCGEPMFPAESKEEVRLFRVHRGHLGL